MLDELIQKGNKYVIYLRKSEDDPKKQVRSIDDQYASCMEIAKREKLHVTQTIQEERSAKHSSNRPKFSAMIADIKKGKIDGIIAWHPDRLARNMKEAGEIIDLLDEKFLVDLRFAALAYTNDYNGKMALGIAFVFAKQYSDKLSVDVTRGNRRALKEGKSGGQFKAGYIRNSRTGFYEPDETRCNDDYTRFSLLKKAWELRIEGETLIAISDFINNHGYSHKFKSTHKVLTMSPQKLVDIFRKPFYYGLLIQAGESVFLPDIYDFTPMISEPEFMMVQSMGRRDLPITKHSYPFKTILICDGCERHLTAGASKGNGPNRLLYYSCSNKKCTNKGSIRARTVIDCIADMLKNLHCETRSHYPLYYEKAMAFKNERQREYMSQKMTYVKRKKLSEEQYEEAVIAISRTTDEMDRSVFEKRKLRSREDIERYTLELSKLDSLIDRGDLLEPDEFLNHVKSLSTSFLSGSPLQKDEIAKNVILNLRIDHRKIKSARAKEPFSSMLDSTLFQNGGPAWT